MTEKVLHNGSCYAPFLIKVGMKREETYDEEEQKVFDFADKDGDGVLNGDEYNRAVCCSGIYPGCEKQSDNPYYEEKFNNIDTNKDGKISKEELEEYIKVETKHRLLSNEFDARYDKIPHHDRNGSIILGALSLGAAAMSTYSVKNKMPSSEELMKHPEYGIKKLMFPKLHDIVNNGINKFAKFGIGAGLLVSALCIGDIVMGNISESKRKELKIEYSDKMYAIVEENPQSEYAKKCYKEQEDYFTKLSEHTEVSLESVKKELERLPKELSFWK